MERGEEVWGDVERGEEVRRCAVCGDIWLRRRGIM